MEKLRKTLVAWNIAPLAVVVFLCVGTWRLIDFIIESGNTLDPIFAAGVLGLIGSITVLLKECFTIMKKCNSNNE